MVDYFNHKANISGRFPLGSFNSAFSFTGSKDVDAAATKTLSSDGFYIPLAKVQLQNSNLMLGENVKRAIPVNWDPPSLGRYYLCLYKLSTCAVWININNTFPRTVDPN
jgi:hypothetical protein